MDSLGLVILAAGEGTRMRSARHKVLHEVAGRPMIRPERTVVIVGHLGDQVRELLGDSVLFADQLQRLGTGHAVMQARPLLEGRVRTVLVLYGDTPLTRPETVRRIVDHHRGSGATLTQFTAILEDATGYGRIIRDERGRVVDLVEEAVATPEQKRVREMNAGPTCIEADWLWGALDRVTPAGNGELYLTGLVRLAVADGRLVETVTGDPIEAMGVNDRAQLAEVERVARERVRRRHLLNGVTLQDPSTCWIDEEVEIGRDTVILPGTFLRGSTRIGEGCLIGPYSQIDSSTIGDRSRVWSSVVEHATVAPDVLIGPIAHLRPGADIRSGCQIGNFAEVKNSVIGEGTQMHHFSYMGDATVGAGVNVGAGSITCNYDSETGVKARTEIGDGVGLGSDTLLIAPVKIGDRSQTGSGAVVTRDVPPDTVVVGVPARPLRSRRE